eukprot:TRINITY_DN1185_c0_g1_i2.p1 TRINITY_DN1185_c0_g1~~TRINITY_DN1185_c0_g1_i2.p1  ORF type:complete len:385 (-),score=112.10 TRINITY_DN1185_c0_g1_i2:64-1119(-)
MWIGRLPDIGHQAQGSIADVRFYRDALSAEQIYTVANSAVADRTSLFVCSAMRITVGSTITCSVTPRRGSVAIYASVSQFRFSVTPAVAGRVSVSYPSAWIDDYVPYFNVSFTATSCGFARLSDGVGQPVYLDIVASSMSTSIPNTQLSAPTQTATTISLLPLRAGAVTRYHPDFYAATFNDSNTPAMRTISSASSMLQEWSVLQYSYNPSFNGPASLTLQDPTGVNTTASNFVYTLPDSTSTLACPTTALVQSIVNCTLTPRRLGQSVYVFSSVFSMSVRSSLNVTLSAPTVSVGTVWPAFSNNFTVALQTGSVSVSVNVVDGVSANSVNMVVIADSVNAVSVTCLSTND